MPRFLLYCLFSFSWFIYIGPSVFADFATDKISLFSGINQSPQLLPLRNAGTSSIDVGILIQAINQLEKNIYAAGDTTLGQQTRDLKKQALEIIQQAKETLDTLNKNLEQQTQIQQHIIITKKQKSRTLEDLASIREQISGITQMIYAFDRLYARDTMISDIKLLTYTKNIGATLAEQDAMSTLYTSLSLLIAKTDTLYRTYTEQLETMNTQSIMLQQEQKTSEQLLEDIKVQEADIRTLYTTITSNYAQNNNLIDEVRGIQPTGKGLSQQKDLFYKNIAGVLDIPDRIVDQKYFTRPTLPILGIQKYMDIKNNNSSGIVMNIDRGAYIRSPAPGIIYKIQKEKKGSHPARMLIVHKHGYVSIILPFSSIRVSEGEVVERGQILGVAGDSIPLADMNISSKKPYIYRELMRDDVLVDPLLFVDISIFGHPNQLDNKYTNKYKDDMLKRTVDMSEVNISTAKTLSSRVAGFLSRYAPEPYNDVTIWLQAAAQEKIDPYFGICVGRAETSFKNFKSNNNIGNVGNDDSGNTREYESPQEGIAALFQVLNNKYLSKYQTIDQLSRFGNKDDYIYASSPINWQANITKCLSTLYGYYVPEDYAFRKP